eukprot:277283-Amphidinium_carterae.2
MAFRSAGFSARGGNILTQLIFPGKQFLGELAEKHAMAHLVFVPPRMTFVAQPLDISYMRPCKAYLKNFKWASHDGFWALQLTSQPFLITANQIFVPTCVG